MFHVVDSLFFLFRECTMKFSIGPKFDSNLVPMGVIWGNADKSLR